MERNVTTSYELTGSTLAILEQLAQDEDVSNAEALTLLIDAVGDLVSRRRLLGGRSGQELLGNLFDGPRGQHPVREHRSATTGDLGAAIDLVAEVRGAWQAKLDADGEPDSFPYEQQETSSALDTLENLGEGETDVYVWELTYPDGGTLHLTYDPLV